MTRDPIESNFAGMISQEGVCIAFTYAAMNNLCIYSGDIKSASLHALTSKKNFIVCEEEFPLEYHEYNAIIKRVLYGGNLQELTTGST